MSLIEQSLWWIVPYALLMLLMVLAMMEFTISLLVKQPHARQKPMGGAELEQLLMTLNEQDKPYRLVAGKDCDLELDWNVVDSSWCERFALVKLTTVYRAHALFDEAQHEVRWYESLRTSSLFLGFYGWRPIFNFSFSIQMGYVNTAWTGQAYGISSGFPPRIEQVYDFELDTVRVKKEIGQVVNRSGWTFRPVIWWFQATRSGFRVLQALVPAPLKRWPARRFWGTLYPASYILGMGYLIAIIGPLDPHNLLMIAGMSAIWWAIWGFLTWALLGFPAFWRRQKR